MKKTLSIIAVIIFVLTLVSCSAVSKNESTEKPTITDTSENPFSESTSETEKIPSDNTSSTFETETNPTPSTTASANVESTSSVSKEEPQEKNKVLVVVFSATGTTKRVADKIAKIENADVYEIKAELPYSSADLNWNDRNSRSTKEQNDKNARPAIEGEKISLDGYSKIYVGFPIWWGEEPRIIDTFVESYDFSGKTMIPFCTSSSSGIGRSGRNLAENAKSGNWLDGRRFSGGVSENELESWINGIK